jgi:CCR4-NOT transcription complex subunit 2
MKNITLLACGLRTLIMTVRPLYQHFASPFADSMSARPLEQDYTLPACYTVQNVHPLQTRIPSFTDETLFYIFYSMPRDVMQEVVAAELTNRNWRYHKVERMWLTRDVNYHEPISIGQEAERGYYIFFDYQSWKKVRREFVLRYADLDDRAMGRSLGAVGSTT